MVRLSDVCNINMGQSPSSDTYNSEHSGLPFFQGNADFGEINPQRRIWCSNPVKTAKIGDILISVRAPIGALNIADTDCCIGRGLAALTVKSDLCLAKYLWYVLQFKAAELVAKGTGSTFKAINKQTLSDLEFLLPSIEIQEKIVEKIDNVVALITHRRKQIKKLDELVKSQFIEMFGDPRNNTQNRPTTEFIKVVKMQRGFDLPVQDRNQNGEIPVFGSNGALDRHDLAKVYGGGVITGRSGTIGKVFYTEGDYWPLNTSLFSVDTHGNNIIYLAYLLQLYDLSRFIEGTGVPTLNRNKFHNEPIIDVPYNEQISFARFVEQTDKSKDVYDSGVAA